MEENDCSCVARSYKARVRIVNELTQDTKKMHPISGQWFSTNHLISGHIKKYGVLQVTTLDNRGSNVYMA
jgi:hypothetical protein